MTAALPALTIHQPWSTLIVAGWKPYEFRSWDYRERRHGLVGKRIAIHASARRVDRDEVGDLLERVARRRAHISEAAVPFLGQLHLNPGMAPLSSVLGTAIIGKPIRCSILFGSAEYEDSTRKEHQTWAWPLTEIEHFDYPIPARGAQGLWIWRQDDEAA